MSSSKQVFFEPTGRRWFITKIIVILMTILIICGSVFLYYTWKKTQDSSLLTTDNEYRTQNTDKNLGVNFYPNQNNQYSSFKEDFENIERVNCFCATIKNDSKLNYINIKRTDDFDLINKFRMKAKKLNQDLNLVITQSQIENFDPSLKFEYQNDGINFDHILIEYSNSKKFETLLSQLLENKFSVNLIYNNFSDISKIIEENNSIKNIFLNINQTNSKNSDIIKKIEEFTKFVDEKKLATKLNLITPSQAYFEQNGKLEELSQTELENLIIKNNITKAEISDKNNAILYKIDKVNYYNFDDSYYYNLFNSLNQAKLLTSINSFNLGSIANEGAGIFDVYKDFSKINEDYLFNTFLNKENVDNGPILKYNDSKKGKRSFIFNNDIIAAIEYQKYPIKGLINYSGIKDKSIAITFDDGPDPVITPKILSILKNKNVTATFYVVGSRAAKYPELIKQIISEGHIIGNHSYSHSPLSNLEEKALIEEIKQTQEVIKQITGEYPKLIRTPFNDSPYHAKEGDIRIIKTAQNMGLTVSEFDTDPNDWRFDRTQDELFLLATQNPKSQLLLHDIGKIEEKEALLIALPKILDYYKNNNYNVVSSYLLANINQNNIASKPFWDISSYLTPDFILNKTKSSIDVVILFFSITSFILLMFIRLFWLVKVNKNSPKYVDDYYPHVSIIIPGYNEESVCVQTVESLINQKYPNYEIIYVDDGSKDRSYEILKIKYILNPRVKIFKKINGGKASALNYGISKSKNDIVIMVDADTQFKKDSIKNLVKHFQNPKIGAVAGNVQVGNDYFTQKANGAKNPKFNLLTIFQRLEYITSQNFFREAFELVNIITIVSGAIGAYRKQAVMEVGGVSTDTLAEDGNLSFDVLAKGWKIVYERNAISLTEAPENLHALYKQRVRWAFGNIQVLWKNRNIMLNRKFGWLGFLAMPFAWNCFIGLIIGPFVSLLTVSYASYDVVVNGQMTADSKLILTAIFWYTIFMLVELTVVSVSVWRDPSTSKFRLIPFFFIYTFLFPFFLFIVSISVIIKIFKGTPQGWGHLKRTANVFLKE
jgi:cellulose synthase/poly-beta-1,6-N-acetylglucosamine synthase-like glycosyltransferase/peptidoglycan/xylan/chitin deacetylase (PgdA/CDA1 family)/uncharacterized protein YxeA